MNIWDRYIIIARRATTITVSALGTWKYLQAVQAEGAKVKR